MTAKIYQKNRQKLIEKLTQADYILVAGNGQMARNKDIAYRFRQDSNLLYLTGINESLVTLLLDTKNGQSYLLVPKPTKVGLIFDGEPDWKHITQEAGLDGYIYENEAWGTIKKRSKIFMNIPNRANDYNIFNNPHRGSFYKKIKKFTGVSPLDARPALAELRMIKQDYEIDNIKEAIKITKNTLKKTIKIRVANKTEKEIENQISANFALAGVEHGYLPIVASGQNAATLHHEATNKVIKMGETLLFDAGAEYNGYSADISETHIVGSNPKLQNVINDVKDVQLELVTSIRPGLTWKEVHEKSVELIADVITKNNLGDRDVVKKMYPHAIGHFVGLDTHDSGDYKQSLQPGMVITIEPGLYSTKHGFGVRIEDEVIITTNGAQIL